MIHNSDISKLIEQEYPNPISSAHRKVRVNDLDDFPGMHDLLGDLFEIIVKYLAVIILQDYKHSNQVPEYIDLFIKKMLHPSLGHWNEIIRTVSSEDTSECTIARKVAAFYKSKVSQELKSYAEQLADLIDSKMNIRTHADIFDLLILYRNKNKGHGAKKSREEYKERAKILEVILEQLLQRLLFLKESRLVYIEEITACQAGEDIKYKHKCKDCSGTQIEPVSFVLDTPLFPNHLVLEVKVPAKEYYLDIYPLFAMNPCRDCKTDQVFVFNDLGKGKLEYLSYSCGHFYYPDMLSSDFEKFFKVSVSSIQSNEKNGPISDEETQELGFKYFSAALSKISTREYFEALELLQISIAYRNSWESNYYSALIGMLLGSPPVEILFYLRTSISLDPDNLKISLLLDKIIRIFTIEEELKNPSDSQLKQLSEIAKFTLEEDSFVPKALPIYTYLVPQNYRKYSYVIWTIVPLVLFLIRGLFSSLSGVEHNFFVQTLKVLLVTTFVTICYYISSSIPDIYFSLQQQVSDKAKDHFKKWFNSQIHNIFGYFIDSESVLTSLNIRNSENQRYFMTIGVLGVASVLGMVYLTCYDNLFSMQSVLLLYDSLVVMGIMVLGVPILIRFFLMLKTFSSFPLKPLIGILSVLSAQRIGTFVFKVSVPWTMSYILLTVLGYITFSVNTVYTQLGLFYYMVGLGCIWTIITPLYLSKALQKSKSKLLARYSEHVEKSFKYFVESPSKEHLESFNWLVSQQGEFTKLQASALSLKVKIGIVAINIFIIISAIAYPFLKYKITFNDVYNWFRLTFL